jgi:hypothetical protein
MAVIVVFPDVPVTSTVILTRADDYKAADSRTISFTDAGWPDLSGLTCTFTVRRRVEAFGGSGSDSVLLETTTVGSATFELTTAQTVLLIPGIATAKFDVSVVLGTGAIQTLAIGLVDVIEDQTR